MRQTTNQSPVKTGRDDLHETREALLALWAVPGVGVKALKRIAALGLTSLLDVSPREWVHAVRLTAPTAERLRTLDRLRPLAAVVRERAAEGRMGIAFKGGPAYPPLLARWPEAPPVLFYKGAPSMRSRGYLALVGSRNPGAAFPRTASAFAAECSAAGMGIVSGAAVGVDEASHQGALAQGGVTWAFVGSALDQLDPQQARLLPKFLEGGGTFFSELPPGVRASRDTFPRRNRLISGASHAVVVLRAGEGSGSLYTAEYAYKQGRPVFVYTPDALDDTSAGSRYLVEKGFPVCGSAEEVLRAVEQGIGRREDSKPRQRVLSAAVELSELSESARKALAHVEAAPTRFEDIYEVSGLPSAALTSALCELELAGWIVQHPGKLYERV